MIMKKISALGIVSLITVGSASPQGRPVDWPSFGGDARRTGWERSDTRITKDNIKDFQLVLKRKFEKQQAGARTLTPPVIIGLLISYKGFKELGFVAGNSGMLWALDVDLNRMFWQKRLEPPPAKPAAGSSPICADALPAIPALTPPITFGSRRPAGLPAATPPGTPVSPGQPPTPAAKPAELPARLGGGGFGGPRPIYLVTSDGKLHQFNTSDGSDQFPPMNFLPANAKASTLTLNANVMYTTTSGNCGGSQDAVWAIDLAMEEPAVASFPLHGGDAGGTGGYALGNDGTVYVQTGPGPSDPASGKWSNTLLALAHKDLKLKDHFSVPASGSSESSPSGMNVTTPVVFEFMGRDLIVSAGIDGRLYLLDSKSIGGADHKTPLYRTPQLTAGGSTHGIYGGISSWEDAEGTRYVAAPVWGPVSQELKVSMTNGATPNGAVVAFKVEEQGGKPVLTPAWVSRDMQSPQAPVITSGVVFALSSGSYTRQGTELRPNNSTRATLYALDGSTGKEMYSTGDQVSAPANLTGAAVANGRVFFTTTDSTLYAFGIHLEI